jgi:hypothetical protein
MDIYLAKVVRAETALHQTKITRLVASRPHFQDCQAEQLLPQQHQ